ncbi:transposase, partial [Pseudoalteromonas luteoviolacea]
MVFDTENGLVRVVQQMLDVLNVKGSVLTMDALHCQTETLKKIADKKAHVVVQVKKNQPNLWNAVNTQFQA